MANVFYCGRCYWGYRKESEEEMNGGTAGIKK